MCCTQIHVKTNNIIKRFITKYDKYQSCHSIEDKDLEEQKHQITLTPQNFISVVRAKSHHETSYISDQTAQISRLICGFADHTCFF